MLASVSRSACCPSHSETAFRTQDRRYRYLRVGSPAYGPVLSVGCPACGANLTACSAWCRSYVYTPSRSGRESFGPSVIVIRGDDEDQYSQRLTEWSGPTMRKCIHSSAPSPVSPNAPPRRAGALDMGHVDAMREPLREAQTASP